MEDEISHRGSVPGRWNLPRPAGCLLLGFALSGLAACHGKSGGDKGSQVLATVNQREITSAQLDHLLPPRGSAPGSAATSSEATKRALDALVGEELLVQGAVKDGLDREPAVVQAVESAKRQVLARTFAERDLYPRQPVAATEVEEFYKGNPILFENRKRFQLKDFAIDSIDLSDKLVAELDRVHTTAELRDLLDRYGIKYSSRADAITADQLPVDKLGEFARANVGDLMIAQPNGGKTLLMFVSGIEDDNPMSFERARPYIESYLANLRYSEAVKDYLDKAKGVAKISYPSGLGEPDTKPAYSPSPLRASDPAEGTLKSGIVDLFTAQKHAAP